ncbi:MAG: tetratricopeptide repeat protein [Chitinophagaceae bacterium]
MADKKNELESHHDERVIAKAKDFWTKYNKQLMIASTIIILAVGSYYIYQNFVKKPKELKAADVIFKAEEYYRMDSVNQALNGDGQNWGFLKVIDKYGSTDAGNLASFYAGSCYIKLNENDKAIKYLKKFNSSSKPLQARAYKLLGDAYADLGKNADALSYYKKAAAHFEKDDASSADYLFTAAYFADRVIKDSKEAIGLYKELKEKFPKTPQASDADNYLAQLGVYNTTN